MTDVTFNFALPDGALPDPPWTTKVGTPSIFSSVAYGAAAGHNGAVYNAKTFSNNQYVEVTLGDLAGKDVGMILRQQAGGGENCYVMDCNPSNVAIWSVAAGVYTLSNSASETYAPGDTLRFEVTGTSLVCKKNGSTICSATDATYASGRPGIWFNDVGGYITAGFAGPALGGSPTAVNSLMMGV